MAGKKNNNVDYETIINLRMSEAAAKERGEKMPEKAKNYLDKYGKKTPAKKTK